MRLIRLAVVFAIALPSGASLAAPVADPLIEAGPVPHCRSLEDQLVAHMSLLGDQLGLQLSALTGDLVRLQFDFARQHGSFGVGGGTGEAMQLRVDGQVEVHGSVARIRSHIALGLGGQHISLNLPPLDLATQTVVGERAYELRLPIFEGHF